MFIYAVIFFFSYKLLELNGVTITTLALMSGFFILFLK